MNPSTNFTTTQYHWYSNLSRKMAYEWIPNSSKTISTVIAKIESTHNITLIQPQQDPQISSEE